MDYEEKECWETLFTINVGLELGTVRRGNPQRQVVS
jgi:hypothetical protein